MSEQSDKVLKTSSSLVGGPALLVLEDGSVFAGRSCGVDGEVFGEICFDTSMVGYLESISDPSYAGQILCMTYPQIGNYGVNKEDMEANKLALRGLVLRSMCTQASNWRSEMNLPEFLLEQGVVAIEGVDTRALTRHIREKGSCRAVISSEDTEPASLLAKLKKSPLQEDENLVASVSCSSRYNFTAPPESRILKSLAFGEPRLRVLVYDYGVKKSILIALRQLGCEVEVVPWDTKAEEVLEAKADGVFLSNGPGSPDTLEQSSKEIAKLFGKIPLCGVCLGHQVICKAAGVQFEKLRFGHRGRNQAVFNLFTGRTEATTQNHDYNPIFSSLGQIIPELSGGLSEHVQDLRSWVRKGIIPVLDNPVLGRIALTHININDGSLEGIACLDIPVLSAQYHPKIRFGLEDGNSMLLSFVQLMDGKKDFLEGSGFDEQMLTNTSSSKGGFWQHA